MSVRGPYAKGMAKREEILAIALEVVAVRGCRKALFGEIAERTGLSHAGLQHYFSSREELFQEVLRTRDRRDHERYFLPDPTFEGFLAIIAHNVTVPGLVRLYAEFTAEASFSGHPAHTFLLQRMAWVRDLLTGVIRREQESGAIGARIDIPVSVDLVIAAADGLQVQWLADPSVDMVARLRRLWTGLVVSSAPG